MSSPDPPHLNTSSSTDALQAEGGAMLVTQPLPLVVQTDTLLASAEGKMPFYDQYRRELEEYRKIFNDNMKNKPVKHDRVYVLMWTWESELDDLGVKEEVDTLQKVFEEKYCFRVERQELTNLEKASHQLNAFLSSFMAAHDESNTLLIFYYAGHGLYQNNTVVLKGTMAQQTEDEKERNNVAWSSAEHNIQARCADVLVIFDCCGAGGFGGYEITGRSTRQPPFQCIAACGRLERTLPPGSKSFTSALIWALEELRPHHPFTSNNLLAKIKEYEHLPQFQHPTLLRRDEYNDGLVWIAPLKLAKGEAVKTPSEHRNPLHEYLDIRLNFYDRVKKSDAKSVAKCLSKLIHENNAFRPKHVVLLDKTSAHSKAIVNFTSNIDRKRKRSASSSTLSPKSSRPRPASMSYADELTVSPIEKPLPPSVMRRQSMTETAADSVPPQSALYHLRMALHCSLQNVRSHIGSVADRIRPPLREAEESLSDVD